MKKLILLMAATMPFFAATGQVLMSEDFDGIGGPTAGGAGTYTFAPGWLLRNVDNATPAASVSYVNEAWERREDFNFSVTDSVAFSTSWYSPAGSSNDWMWSPSFTVLPNTLLSWNAVTYDPTYPDGYEVRIMTQTSSPGGPTGGPGVIGNQLTNSTVLFSIAAENASWTARQASLSAYAGQTVWIGFRNNSTDKFVLLIDDIIAQVIVNNDLSVSNVSHGEYTVSPAEHQTTTANFELKGTLTNNGLQAMTNARLACDVSVDGTLLTTVQSTPIASIAASGTANATIPFTPTVGGAYTFKFYPMATETDQTPANDTISDPNGLIIDPLVMRRDNGVVTGSLGIGAGTTGYIGQTFRFETPVNIAAIESYHTRGYVGRPIFAVIYSTNASGVPTTFYASTDTLTYIDDSARLYTMPMNGGTLTLPAGEYGFLQVESDSTLALANTSALFTPNSVYVQWAANGPNFVPVETFGASFSKSFVIYPKFDLCVGETGGTVANSTDASCGLSDGSAEVTLEAGYTILWEDSTTNAINNGLPAGIHTYTVTNGTCSFTDSVEIFNPNAPTASVQQTTNALCFGETGTIDLDIQGGAAPYTVIWSNGNMGATLTATAGTYSATIIDDNNCQVNVSNAEITQPTTLTATSSGTDETCTGCNDGTASVTPSGGTAPYAVTWSNGSTGTSITGLAPGTYVANTVDVNGCSTDSSVVVVDAFVGIDELTNYGIVVYPNPVHDYLSIEAKKNNVLSITLLDASGRMIGELTKANNVFTVDMRSLSKGMYQVVIKTDNGTIVSSVAKQ